MKIMKLVMSSCRSLFYPLSLHRADIRHQKLMGEKRGIVPADYSNSCS